MRQVTTGALVRAGVGDVAAGRDHLASIGEGAVELLPLVGRTADPDQTLKALALLLAALDESAPESEATAARRSGRADLLEALRADEGTAMRLLSVLGASQALADHLVRHPQQWHELQDPQLGSTRPPASALRADLVRAVGGDPTDHSPVATLPDAQALDALRVEYRRLLLRLAARDLTHHLSLGDTAAELSDLAAGTLEAGLAVARARVGEAAAGVRLSVLAMGKCGGHELNYVSDVDVIFVHEPGTDPQGAPTDDQLATRTATQLATHLIQVCSEQTAEGTIWPVDANLRPEGRSGPLTRTLASHRGYYERWAKTWEFQALLKARPVAGDLALGLEWTDMAAEVVWTAAERDGFVADVQAMRRRVLEHIPAKEARRQLKLGSGGLRDVEFAVQLMQLVHGRADRSLRVSSTLGALAALTAGGYVGREDGEALRQAYAFLRTLEHRAVPVNGDHLAPGLLRADPATGHEHELTFHRGRAEELRAVYEDAVRCSPPVAGILQVRVVPRGGVEWLALEAQGVEIDHALDGDRAGGLKDDAGQVVGIGGRLQAGHGRLGDPDAHRDSSQVCASRACSASAYGASSPSQPQAWQYARQGRPSRHQSLEQLTSMVRTGSQSWSSRWPVARSRGTSAGTIRPQEQTASGMPSRVFWWMPRARLRMVSRISSMNIPSMPLSVRPAAFAASSDRRRPTNSRSAAIV